MTVATLSALEAAGPLEVLASDAALWDRFAYGVIESPVEIRFETAEGLRALPNVAAFPVGRLFGPKAELRWRKLRSGRFRLALIDDGRGSLPDAADTAALEPVEVDQAVAQVLLWGELEEPDDGAAPSWYEGRIPNPIRYPVPAELQKATRLALRTKTYRIADPAVDQAGRPSFAPEPRYIDSLFERYVELIRAPAGRGS